MKKILTLAFAASLTANITAQNTAWPTPSGTTNVGIGTAYPTYKLHVVGTTAGSEFITPKVGLIATDVFSFDSKQMYQNGVQFVSDSWKTDGFTTWLSGWGGIRLFTGGQPRFSMNAYGSIGIGITAPLADLHIEKANSSIIRLSTNNSPGGPDGYYTEIINKYDFAESFAIRHHGYNIIKSKGNAEAIEIGHSVGTAVGINLITASGGKTTIPNGKVVIGNYNTAVPDYLLSVKGNIVAQKVKVTQTNWADYVFDSSYSLMPLQDVATYITTNKHLPFVPSAAVVEKEGIDIGESQATLLRKIEELTLYMIEMNNTIKKQSAIIEKQSQVAEKQQKEITSLQEIVATSNGINKILIP